MTDEVEPEKVVSFDAEYVKELRTEAASWRHRVRELEDQIQYQDVTVEFARRGINLDPKLINIPEGMTAVEVADQFSSIFGSEPETAIAPKTFPSGIVPNSSKANASGPPAQGAFGGRSLKEIEADPRAREQVRSLYRELVNGNSHNPNPTIYDS